MFPALAGGLFTTEPLGKPKLSEISFFLCLKIFPPQRAVFSHYSASTEGKAVSPSCLV